MRANSNMEKASHFGVFQAGAEIIESQGWKGLFQGHSATLLRIFPYAAIKFMAYEQIKFVMMPTKRDETHWKKFVAGSLAGCTSVFCSYPLDLLRVRLALEIKANSESGIRAACRSIFREPTLWNSNPSRKWSASLLGLTNFYKGFMPTMYGMIPYAGVSFLTYESLKTFASTHFVEYTLVQEENKTNKSGQPRLRAWAYLTCGALSGALAQTASYPLEVIRRMMQVAGSEALPTNMEHRNTISTAKSIGRRKGLRGFYVGLTIGYIKVAPMFAVSFYVYEAMKKQLGIGEV